MDQFSGRILLGGTVTERRFGELVTYLSSILGVGPDRSGQLRYSGVNKLDLTNAQRACQREGLSVYCTQDGDSVRSGCGRYYMVDPNNIQRVRISYLLLDSTETHVVPVSMLNVMPTGMLVRELFDKITSSVPELPRFEIQHEGQISDT